MNEIHFVLREPFWSAWKKYGWTKGNPGFGISVELIQKAHAEGKKIVAEFGGYGYRISPVTINNFYKESTPKPIFEARGGVKLVVIPQTKFENIGKIITPEETPKQSVQMLSLF